MTAASGVRALYEATLAERGYHSDAAQLGAIEGNHRFDRAER